jgi:hypothetical protein
LNDPDCFQMALTGMFIFSSKLHLYCKIEDFLDLSYSERDGICDAEPSPAWQSEPVAARFHCVLHSAPDNANVWPVNHKPGRCAGANGFGHSTR